jgi:hypothetical protein
MAANTRSTAAPSPSDPGFVNDRDQVTVRQTSSEFCNTQTVANLIVGGAPRGGGFSVTTLACDSAPDPFGFDSQLNKVLNATAQSNTITVSGINTGATVTISGAASSAYSIGCTGDNWTNEQGTIFNTNTICVRHTTAGTVSTQTVTTLTIGGVAGTFTTTTAAQQTLSVRRSG